MSVPSVCVEPSYCKQLMREICHTQRFPRFLLQADSALILHRRLLIDEFIDLLRSLLILLSPLINIRYLVFDESSIDVFSPVVPAGHYVIRTQVSGSSGLRAKPNCTCFTLPTVLSEVQVSTVGLEPLVASTGNRTCLLARITSTETRPRDRRG